MKRRFVRATVAPTLAVFVQAFLLPVGVFAQDDGGFVFDEEEVEEFGEPMEFGEDEVWDDWDVEDPIEDEPEPVIVRSDTTAIMVPADAINAFQADQLTAAVQRELATIDDVTVVANDGLRAEFEIMGAELALECAFDPVCLGRYGRDLGLGRVVVGRVSVTDDGMWGTTLDLFETETSSIVNYRYFVTEPDVAAVDAALADQIRALFGIRADGPDGMVGRSGPSTGQRVAAWSTAALAVGSLGAGIAFGLQSRSIEDDLRNCSTVIAYDGEPVCDLTQREANGDIDDGKRAARLSNVFIGTGLMLGVVSTVLFTVTPGSDIDESAEGPGRDWAIAPSADRSSFGVSGHVRF